MQSRGARHRSGSFRGKDHEKIHSAAPTAPDFFRSACVKPESGMRAGLKIANFTHITGLKSAGIEGCNHKKRQHR